MRSSKTESLNNTDNQSLNDTNSNTAELAKSQRACLLFALVLSAILICYWFPVLSGQGSFFISDHTYYFEPFSKFIGEAFRQWRLPLWNPYLYSGMSEVAVPSPGVFYPGSLLFALTSYSQAVALQMLLHQLLAGVGMFLLVASFGWGLAPAAVAALIVSLTGYMFSLTSNCTLAFSASSLPLSLWAFRGIALTTYAARKHDRYWRMVIAVICVFLLITAGRPEVYAPGSGVLALYCILEGLRHYRKGVAFNNVFAGWSWQLVAFLTGLAMAMPAILPIAEWAAISPRAKGLAVNQVLMWSANWYDLACLVCPQPFGDLLVLGSKYLHLVAARPTFYPYITSLFVGPVCLSLSVWGFFDRSWAWRKWLLLALALFLIMCIGEYSPIAPYLVRTFSSLSVLRYPIKMMIFPIIFLAVAAARGSKALLSGEIGKAARIFTICFWTLSLVIGVTYLVMGMNNMTMPWKDPLPVFAEVALGRSVIGTALLGIVCCIGEYLRSKERLSKRTVAWVVVIGVLLNLIVVAICNRQMTTKSDFFEHEQTLNTWMLEQEKGGVSRGRLLNLFFDPVQVPSDYKYDRTEVWTANFFAYSRAVLLCNTGIDCHRAETFGYEAGETLDYRNMVLSAVHDSHVDKNKKVVEGKALDLALLRVCQSTATKWVATQVFKNTYDLRLLNPQYFEVVRESRPLNLRLYKVRAETPRAYFSQYWRWMDRAQIGKESLVQPGIFQFAPLSVPQIERGSAVAVPHTYKVLAPEIPKAPDHAPKLPDSLSGEILADRLGQNAGEQSPNSTVTVMLDQPEHVSVSIANKRPGFLILCDHFYPGWCALVDSVQVPVYKANIEMRAIYLPAGTHLVEFDFHSESLNQGFLIALGGLTILLGFFLCAIGPAVWRFVKSTAGQ